MLIKGLALTALVASTPLALLATQDPEPTRAPVPTRAAAGSHEDPQQARRTLDATRAELDAARRDLQALRRQLEAALDRLDEHHEPQRDRDCSPSRGRALMSHFRWLQEQGHEQRAGGVLARVVDGLGDDPDRLHRVARDLMTDEETAGRFDEVALALTARMQQRAANPSPRQLDTAALACFLNGRVQEAIVLQRRAIDAGGRGDDYRRRLRTYQAGYAAIAQAGQAAAAPEPTRIARREDE